MTRGKEILVGVVIVLGVAIALVGTLWLQDASFGRGTREVAALFVEVGQLMNGNSVKLRGVTIGRVVGVSVEPDGRAVRVRMRIRDDVLLPADPAVLVAPESLFGDWQAEIVPRSAYAQFDFYPYAGGGTMAGYALPDISRLTASLDQISKNLGSLTSRVEETFTDETARNLARAIDNIEEVSHRLRDLVEVQAAAFSDLATEVESAAVELGDAARAANEAFQRAEGILGAPGTDSLLADARVAMVNLRAVSEELGSTNRQARSFLAHADSTFARLSRLTYRVEAGEGALGALMGDQVIVARTREVLDQLNLLLKDLKENPQRYVRISIF